MPRDPLPTAEQPCLHPIEARRTNTGQVTQVYEVCSACETRLDPAEHPSGSPQTLLLTFALPDFYADGLSESAGFYDGNLTEAFYEEAGLISSTARLSIMSGDKGGNDLHSMRAVLVSASVVDRVPAHDEPEDERLTAALEEDR